MVLIHRPQAAAASAPTVRHTGPEPMLRGLGALWRGRSLIERHDGTGTSVVSMGCASRISFPTIESAAIWLRGATWRVRRSRELTLLQYCTQLAPTGSQIDGRRERKSSDAI